MHVIYINIYIYTYIHIHFSCDEEEHERGIAHYLEHIVFLGTEKYPSNKEMKKLFSQLGMAFNADANAYTDFRYGLMGKLCACVCIYVYIYIIRCHKLSCLN